VILPYVFFVHFSDVTLLWAEYLFLTNMILNFHKDTSQASIYDSVSQTVVRGPQVVLGVCPCGPLRLNISPKKTEKNKINVNCVLHTCSEYLKK